MKLKTKMVGDLGMGIFSAHSATLNIAGPCWQSSVFRLYLKARIIGADFTFGQDNITESRIFSWTLPGKFFWPTGSKIELSTGFSQAVSPIRVSYPAPMPGRAKKMILKRLGQINLLIMLKDCNFVEISQSENHY